MPSDPLPPVLRAALAPHAAAFHSALAATVDQVRGLIEEGRAPGASAAPPLALELGPFAAGRIDASRLAGLAASAVHTDGAARPVLERALSALLALGARGEALYRVDVHAGASLRDAVGEALAQVGRAFGAGRVVERARSGRFAESEHGAWLDALPYARWTKAERRLAPPLVVEVDGADLSVGGLSEFLDGAQKLVLLVRNPATPAPLARLVTPGTYVAQSASAEGLERLLAFDGPGVGAVLAEGAARFVHDPAAAGATPRLSVEHVPGEQPRAAVGPWSPRQQADELRHLVALSRLPGLPAAASQATGAGTKAAGGGDPVERLAAWLLQQADA